jgi:PHD/YefM family antitoxin component YafN of YafNO toxin-antitoxin module
MFKKTITANELRAAIKENFSLVKENGEAIQITHRGNPIRVLITQGYYLDMLAKIEHYEMELGIREIPERGLPKPNRDEDALRLRKRREELEKRESEA